LFIEMAGRVGDGSVGGTTPESVPLASLVPASVALESALLESAVLESAVLESAVLESALLASAAAESVLLASAAAESAVLESALPASPVHVEAPQYVVTSPTHWASHALVQQYESWEHTAVVHESHEALRAFEWVVHSPQLPPPPPSGAVQAGAGLAVGIGQSL
jgi:hypothetical protein